MSSSVAAGSAFLPSLSARARAALPLGPTACATRQKRAPCRSLERELGLFREEVWKYWRENGRHDLPWRKLRPLPTGRQAYHVLVSEVMLQQTQVSRVSGKYRELLKTYPAVRHLAKAPLVDVLKIWSGLGYNRRAKYLHDAAKQIVKVGNIKKALEGPLPGVGPYTKAAVRVFAFNEPDVLLETNIRTAFIHHFFSDKKTITDRELIPLIKITAEGQDPRKWHWALMDYGAHLKRSGVRNNNRNAHYTKQSRFEGSLRQVRGAILRVLADGAKIYELIYRPIRANRLIMKTQLTLALTSLARDGLIVKEKGQWRIA